MLRRPFFAKTIGLLGCGLLGCVGSREAPATPAPTAKLDLEPPADPGRDRAIRARFGDGCRLERTCGSLYGVDCNAAADGPYYYVRPGGDRFAVLATCGGACMSGQCTNCPPVNEGWTCPAY